MQLPQTHRSLTAIARALLVGTSLALALIVLGGCTESDKLPVTGEPNDSGSGASDADTPDGNDNDGAGGGAADAGSADGSPMDNTPQAAPEVSAPTGTADFGWASDPVALVLVEGEEPATAIITIAPVDGFTGNVALTTRVLDSTLPLVVQIFSSTLNANGPSAQLSVALPIGAAPIQPATARIVIEASGPSGTGQFEVGVQIQPTARPDLYLLAGQSNMVGFSEDNSRKADPGEPDAPDARILQLNVTGNDYQLFNTPGAFTDPQVITAEPRLSVALDPLHTGFNTNLNGKEGERIGPGLAFAKALLPSTTAEIVLIPTAWADTGFCLRDTYDIAGMGWNAVNPENPAFGGTLLHDRAIARANLAIEQTGGILRGILWHQGEADSSDPACAGAYADNLTTLVASLRTNIAPDARGAAARGTDADIPFVAATMSRGNDPRGVFADFDPVKSTVDAVHRAIPETIANSAVVNSDDLAPPAYNCGESSCIHFGAAAYREMGNRYARALQSLVLE